MIRALKGAACAIAMSLAASANAQVAGVPLEMEPGTCMRECLEAKVESYVQAMVDGTVSDELFARNVRFTENGVQMPFGNDGLDRKSTRLNSSHVKISYAVFCLKKKKRKTKR